MHVKRSALDAAPVGISALSPVCHPSETDPPSSAKYPVGGMARKATRREAAPRNIRHVATDAPDNRPTPERATHNEIRSQPVGTYGDTRVRLVIGAVEALHRKGEIEDVERDAADRWYRDYATGVEGGRDPVDGRSSGQSDAHDAQIARIDAVNRCSAVRLAIGFCGEARLRAVVFDQLTLAAAAERLLPGKADGARIMRGQVQLLLQQLAEHYREVDRARAARKRLTERTEPA